MVKKVSVVVLFVFTVLLVANYCLAGKRSLGSDKQIDEFISSLKKDSKYLPVYFDGLKEELVYARGIFDEASALQSLSKIDDPNDHDAGLCGSNLMAFTYLYYDDPVKLEKLYNNMSNYSKDRFFALFDLAFLKIVDKPFFEISKKYLQDLVPRWRTEKFRDKKGRLLEIGVQHGGSSLLWHEYLPHFYLDLVDQIELVFDGVLDCQDVSFRATNQIER